MTLTAEHYPEFYRAVNGYAPFPWQARLVEEVVKAGGLWPAVLDLPTSAGKTSALDAAVFLLALEAGKSVHVRRAAIRTFFVVDRRIVVDEAAERAGKLADKLNAREIAHPVVRNVADRLKSFSGEQPKKGQDPRKALHVSVLRGGMYRDGSWAESPTQPTICLSTVDQVGSRLLFRGYGVSSFQRALHAGLAGNDTLILVDEAHLSRPFLETLRAVEFYRSAHWAEQPLPTPFQVVVMSATAGTTAGPVGPDLEAAESQRPRALKLDEGTDKNPAVCPELHRRLTAKKRTKLVEAGDVGFVPEVVKQAISLAESEKGIKPVQVVGVVVNRVRTARQVAQLLRTMYLRENPLPEGESDRNCPAVVLLTGRIRPYDRDELLFRRPFRESREPGASVHGLLPFVKAQANLDRTDYERPPPPHGVLFVVATQTVEVGADFSFDALVTELAPLDALRQRLGRVDRLGFRAQSQVVIVRNKEADKDDPVYGLAPTSMWKVLREWEKASRRAKEIDFGIQAIENRLPQDPEERQTFLAPLCAPFSRAPVMMPAHLDDWAHTSIPPCPDPDPALFLHGPQAGPPDVSLVWRADITRNLLESDLDGQQSRARQVVALVPPSTMEALPLPAWHVRRWLQNRRKAAEDAFTDLEGEQAPQTDRRPDQSESSPFLIWAGPQAGDNTRVSRNPEDIRPGCTVVVPADYGGCDEFGWDPAYTEAVSDVADDCSWRARRRPVIRVHCPSRVHEAILSAWRLSPSGADGRSLAESLSASVVPDESTGQIPRDAVLSVLRSWVGLPDWLARAVKDRRARQIPYPTRDGVLLSMPIQKPAALSTRATGQAPIDDRGRAVSAEPATEEAPAEDDGGSFPGNPVSLDDHCKGVQALVDQFAACLQLRPGEGQVLSRAALLHDAGKADPRFQIWLYGSEAAAARKSFELIAKSGLWGFNAAAVEAARRQAGWPKGARHEAASVLLVRAGTGALAGLGDPELAEYLIGTHHGRGRPLWPLQEDDEVTQPPAEVTVALQNFALKAALPARPEQSLAPLHAGWADLFWRLLRRYGYWGIAYLEALLVIADHRQSASEQEGQA